MPPAPGSAPIHFEGSLPNASGTARSEVGGLAVFDGVMMRSRTGFAIAIRRPDGAIDLAQFPFASLVSRHRVLGLPIIRGAAALGEMMVIGTAALRHSTREEGAPPSDATPEDRWQFASMLAVSLALLAVLVILLPGALASATVYLFAPGYNEADHPLAFHLLTGAFRLLVLLIYVVALGFNQDIRRVFEYHGSEHMAVLALEEGRDVTVARARAHDTLHPRCGTTFLALLAIISIGCFAATDALLASQVSGFPDWSFLARRATQVAGHLVALPFAIGLAFETIKWAGRQPRHPIARVLLQPGYWLQRLTTRRPDDRQLEVAIIALLGALAITPWERSPSRYTVRGLEDDESAPGYIPRSPARPAPPDGTPSAQDQQPMGPPSIQPREGTAP